MENNKKKSVKVKKINLRSVKKILPSKAHADINKTSRGHLLVIAGSVGMEGAGSLSSLAGAHCGAGYVTWARWPQEIYQVPTPPVIMSSSLDNKLSFLKKMKRPTAVVIGPGLGVNSDSKKLLKKIFSISLTEWKEVPVVVDADGLKILKLIKCFPVPSSWILTPHLGELSFVLTVSTKELLKNRIQTMLNAKNELGGIILLKGHHSLIIDEEFQIYENQSGCCSLAKAGTGDVLSGMIGGFLAQGMIAKDAILAAVFLHGLAAEIYEKRYKNDFSMIATDLIGYIPEALKKAYS